MTITLHGGPLNGCIMENLSKPAELICILKVRIGRILKIS